MADKFAEMTKYDELALAWVRAQDLSGKTPKQFAEMFKTARKEIQDALRSESSRNCASNPG